MHGHYSYSYPPYTRFLNELTVSRLTCRWTCLFQESTAQEKQTRACYLTPLTSLLTPSTGRLKVAPSYRPLMTRKKWDKHCWPSNLQSIHLPLDQVTLTMAITLLPDLTKTAKVMVTVSIVVSGGTAACPTRQGRANRRRRPRGTRTGRGSRSRLQPPRCSC